MKVFGLILLVLVFYASDNVVANSCDTDPAFLVEVKQFCKSIQKEKRNDVEGLEVCFTGGCMDDVLPDFKNTCIDNICENGLSFPYMAMEWQRFIGLCLGKCAANLCDADPDFLVEVKQFCKSIQKEKRNNVQGLEFCFTGGCMDDELPGIKNTCIDNMCRSGLSFPNRALEWQRFINICLEQCA